jgi:hypothetical protein
VQEITGWKLHLVLLWRRRLSFTGRRFIYLMTMLTIKYSLLTDFRVFLLLPELCRDLIPEGDTLLGILLAFVD